MRILIAVALAAGVTAPGWAATCPQPQGWAKPVRHLAARNPTLKFALKPGSTARIDLAEQNQVTFAAGQATRKGYAGLAAIDVPKAGILQVVLDNRTYVDLVRDGKTVPIEGEPQDHGCPGIRKALDFKVEPGRYLVQLSGSRDPAVKIASSLR